MVEITITGEEPVRLILDEVARKVDHIEPLLDEICEILHTSIMQNFEEEGRPAKWQALKKPKTYAGSKILQQTSILRNTIHSEVVPGGMRLVTGIKDYAAVHQFGFPPSGIPQRKYMMAQSDDEKDITDAADKYFTIK